MLRLADPDVEPDRDLKLRTVLDRAAQKISTRFQDRPAVEAEIRLQIGRSYSGLGEYSSAKQQFEACAELAKSVHGENSDEYWIAYQELASTEFELGEYQTAMDMLTRVNRREEELWGVDSLDATLSRSSIASCIMMLGDTKTAADLQRQILADVKFSNDISLINRHRAKLAHMEFQLAHYDQAQRLLELTLESMDQENALQSDARPLDGNIDYIQALHSIGLIQDARNEFDEAESTHRKTLEMATRLLGPDHPRRLQFVNNLAISLLNQAKTSEAKELLDEAIPAMEASIGSEHDITVAALNTLAGVHITNKDYETAEATWLKARASLLKKFAPPHQSLLTNANNLAGLYLATNRLKQAEEWFEKSYMESLQLFDKHHRYSITSLANLALTRRKMGKIAEAEQAYLEAISLARNSLSAEHPDTLHYMRGLAFLYETNGRDQEAETLLRDVIEIYSERFGPDYQPTNLLKNRLAAAVLRQGRIEESIPFFEEVYDFHRRHDGETHEKTVSVFWALVRTEQRAKRFDQVMDRIERLEQQNELDNWLSLRLLGRKGEILLDQEKFEDAERLLIASFDGQQNAPNVATKDRIKELIATARNLRDLYAKLEDDTNKRLWQEKLDDLKSQIDGSDQ